MTMKPNQVRAYAKLYIDDREQFDKELFNLRNNKKHDEVRQIQSRVKNLISEVQSFHEDLN